MIVEDAIEDLQDFNERLADVEQSAFWQRVQAAWDVQIVSHPQHGWTTLQSGPDRADMKAVAGDLRLFQQDNDRIALHELDKLYHGLRGSSLIVDERVQAFDGLRQKVIDLLTATTPLFFGDYFPKRYELVEVFLYGDWAHVKRDKRAVHKVWKASQAYGLLEATVIDTMARSIEFYKEIAELNQVVIEHLRPGNPKAQFKKQETSQHLDTRINADALRKMGENTPSAVFDMGQITQTQNPDGIYTLRGTYTTEPFLVIQES